MRETVFERGIGDPLSSKERLENLVLRLKLSLLMS